jgi:hypothetical protein
VTQADKKIDLLDIPHVKSLIKNRAFQPLIQIIFVLGLIVIIIRGLASEPDLRFQGGDPFATTMIWDVWHPLLVFSLIFFGRMWCFACPLGALGDWGQRIFSLEKKYPEKYRNLWFAIILFLLLFAGERHLFMFTRNPASTAYLLLAFTGLALLMGLIYEGRSFCRYICPIGLVLGIFSMLAATELRCKSRKTCSEHEVKECIIGSREGKPCPVGEFPQTLERNNRCIYCTECIKTCSKDNIRISPRMPGSDLIKSRKVYLDEAFLIHSIIVIFLFVLAMERFSFRQVIISFVKSTLPFDSITFLDLYWRNMWAIIIFASISLLAFSLMYLSTRMTFYNGKRPFIDLSYAFIPLALSVYLAENTFRFLKGILFIISTIGGWFGYIWVFDLTFESILMLQIALLLLGFLGSIWAVFRLWSELLLTQRVNMIYHIRRKTFTTGKLHPFISSIPIFFLLAVYTWIGLKILTLPIV